MIKLTAEEIRINQKKSNRKSYLNNREKVLKRVKQYNKENKESIAEYQKEYGKRYRAANKEYIKETQKFYRLKYKLKKQKDE